MSLYQIITALQQAKGTKAKQAILEQHKDNELLREYLKAVYDPAINYYMTKLPKVYVTGVHNLNIPEIQDLIDSIAGRKYTGKAAVTAMNHVLKLLTSESQELLGYIIKRDIKAGIAESTVLKVWPGLFFIPPYMRCAGMDDKVLAYYASLPFFYVQTKMDGQFGYLQKTREGVAKAFSRAGSYYPSWVAEKLAVGVPDGFVLMGELLVVREGKLLDRKTGNGVLNSLLSGEGSKYNPKMDELEYVAWDMVTEDEFLAGYSPSRYTDRLLDLTDVVNSSPYISPVSHHLVYSIAEATTLNTQKILEGEEGTVWKDPNGVWRDTSSGTKDAVKAKVKFQAEYRVTGKFEGTGKYVGMLGGFNIETSDGLIKSDVGSGFDDAQRKEYWEADTEGWIITVEANDVITRKGSDTESLFLPIFIERRLDKKEADNRNRVLQQLQSAKGEV